MDTLKFDLQGIFRDGLYPIEQLLLEGNVVAKKRDNEESNMDEQFALTQEQITWLQERYKFQSRGERISDKALRVALHGRISTDFDPSLVHGLFTNREDLTGLGLAVINPDDEHVHAINKSIKAIREILFKNPDVARISASEISRISRVGERETELIIEDMAHWKGLFHGSGIGAGPSGWKAFNVEKGVLENYLKYENVQQVLEGLRGRKSKMPMTKSEATTGISYQIAGDYVGGNQVKAGDNNKGDLRFHSDGPNSISQANQSKWLRGDVIAITGIIVAILLFLLGYPGFKSWTCERWQVLCDQKIPN